MINSRNASSSDATKRVIPLPTYSPYTNVARENDRISGVDKYNNMSCGYPKLSSSTAFPNKSLYTHTQPIRDSPFPRALNTESGQSKNNYTNNERKTNEEENNNVSVTDAIKSKFISGAGDCVMDKVVNQLVVNTVKENLGMTEKEINSAKTFLPNFILSLKNYFAVSHAYVCMRLLALFFPYLFILKEKQLNKAARKYSGMNISSLDKSDIMLDASSSSGNHSESFSKKNVTSFFFCSSSFFSFSFSSFFSSSLKVDLYIPLMSFMTYVLVFGLARGAANDFSPELLGTTASYAFILLILEVLVFKITCYLTSIYHISILDIVACCAYKYANLVVIILLGLLINFVIFPIDENKHIFYNEKYSNNVDTLNIINAEVKSMKEGNNNINTVGKGGRENMRSSWLLFNEKNLMKNSSLIYSFCFFYLTICVSLELYRNITYLKNYLNEEYNNVYRNNVNYDVSNYITHHNTSQMFFKYALFFLVFLQVPICWFLVPSLDVKK